MVDFQVQGTRTPSEFDEAYDDARHIQGAVFSEPLGKVPRRPMVTVPVTATVAEAISAMNERHCGCTLVLREGRLAGIFTERDVLTKVAGRRLPPTTRVEEVMTADPDTLPASASIAYALRHMSVEGYRHVPLVDDVGRPLGVVGVRDIVGWMVSLFPDSVLHLPPLPKIPVTPEGG
ncbi:MAG: cyclic nucleotide-binding/CBS domain-containing protein [Myxococcota bacterium]